MATNKQPYLVLISGPNGAGKTTLYNLIIKGNHWFQDAVFINFNYANKEKNLFQDAVFINQDIKFANILSEPINLYKSSDIKYDASVQKQQTKTDLIINSNNKNILQELDSISDEQYLATMELQMKAGRQTLDEIKYSLTHKKNFIYETTGSGHFSRKLINRAKKEYGYKVFSIHPYVYKPELSVARIHHRVQMGGHNVPKDTVFYRYQNSLNDLPDILSLVDCGIVLDNSYALPYRPIFMVCNNILVNFAECPDYLKNAHDIIAQQYKEKLMQDIKFSNHLIKMRDVINILCQQTH